MSNINAKNFASKLTTTINSHSTQRDNLNALLVFGLEFYNGDHTENSGDTVYLTKVLNACIGVKSLSTIKMKNFIKAHANVSWNKTTDGSMVFKKNKKEAVNVTMPDIKWYEFENEKSQPKADVHPMTQLKSWLTRAEKAVKDGLVKDSEELDKTLESIQQIKAVLA